MCYDWLKDILPGSIGGALSGLAVNYFSRKSDKKELRRVSLEYLKIKLEEYKRNSEAMSIDRTAREVLCDDKTQETIKKLQEILVKIKEYLIHCPKYIRNRVLDFDKLCNKKDQNLIIAMLDCKKNGKSTIDIVKEIKKVDEAYFSLIKEIEKIT